MPSHKQQIQIKNLTVRYGKKIALENITGTFEPNSLTAIIGPNGGGKSTFIKTLQKQIKPNQGSVNHHCMKICETAYLPQKTDLDASFPLTVFEVVGMGLWPKIGSFAGYAKSDQTIIHQSLEKVGLKGYANRSIQSLSGGQFQRMLFARIMIQDSSLIILDEPFTSIDTTTCQHLLKLILEWHREGKTIIVALHNLDLVKEFFPMTLLLGRTVVGWGKTKSVLTEANLQKSFKNLMV